MKEITILSGKGGTGKTSITSALATLARNAVFCDNDVDAADLHLILEPAIEEEHIFKGAWEAFIDSECCNACGLCADYCRFGAIHPVGNTYEVNTFQCEGCRLCERVCPEKAIHSEQSIRNRWFVSATRFGKMVHANMLPGEENSGKLVATIREKARQIARLEKQAFIINDGPPGIGCAAISSITGTDHILLVIEPSRSGLHDAVRVCELAGGFNIPVSAIINKYNLSTEISKKAEAFLLESKISLLAKIPFDHAFVEAMIEGKSIVEYAPASDISKRIQAVWEQIRS